MKILFLCHEFPVSSYAGTLRVLNSLERLSGKHGHDITLLAFKFPGKDYPDISRWCKIETVELQSWPGLRSPGAVISALINIIRGRFSLFSIAYSPEMAKKFCSILTKNHFDLLVIDHPVMLCYTAGLKIPKVLLEAFELGEIARMEYENEKNRLVKIARWFYYRQMRGYADRYSEIDKIIAVSNGQRETVLAHRSDLDIEVITFGVDTDYFRAGEAETEFPSLVITGTMSTPSNKNAVLNFYRGVFPLVKSGMPGIKLYIVGNNPDKDILALAKDESVVVTGYVEDLRPYLSRAWAVIAPLQEGFGVKIRVLQAMAVGKPVVATSMVGRGLNASPEENIVIADRPQEMADKILELLNSPEKRKSIGAAARKLMETNHNWDKLTERFNAVLEAAAGKKQVT